MAKKMGRPRVEDKKVRYDLYFRPSFMEGLIGLARKEGLTTSQLVEKKFRLAIERDKKK